MRAGEVYPEVLCCTEPAYVQIYVIKFISHTCVRYGHSTVVTAVYSVLPNYESGIVDMYNTINMIGLLWSRPGRGGGRG